MTISSASPRRVLTGITTSGTPHIGNYVGAIRPAIAASLASGAQSFFFLADYHALIKCDDPLRVQRSTLEIAAAWLAAGLDTERVTFYRQSDVPEIPELTWLLTCVTGKGILNRAHAYKAAVDKNVAAEQDPDADVSAGLFMYPVLMAADILMFNAHDVPVGRDQVQHIEMTRDIAQRFNHLYGEHFTLPQAVVEEAVALLPGLDGRKMSKSYDNTIPLSASKEQLRRLIGGIVTDSRAPGEPKDSEGSALFDIYRAFASPQETDALRQAYAGGIAWSEAKQLLLERMEQELAPVRSRYEALMSHPEHIEQTLLQGAQKARALAGPLLKRLRAAVGLRSLTSGAVPAPAAPAIVKAQLANFKQYRENDGKFYFKLVAASGDVLLQSLAFDGGRDAGQMVSMLKSQGAAALQQALPVLSPLTEAQQAQAASALDALAQAAAQAE